MTEPSRTTPQTAIRLEAVVKRYGAENAVDGIDLEIRRGELVTLLGPSGCGKTTTLRLIAGLELPTAGRVCIAGSDVTGEPASARNVGMVFQSYALFPHISVLENVSYGPMIRGVSKRDARARAHELLTQIGLAGLHDRLPSELSGGQQQRVALSRAIAQQPDVILFDEPLSNVDAKLRRRVRNEIRSLQQEFGLTAVYVTHDQEEALAVSDRIVVMNEGSIAQIGTPSALYEKPESAFIANFVGEANLIDGQVVNGRFHADTLTGAVSGPDAEHVRIAVRPERIRLHPGDDARVIEATYLGSRMEYLIRTGTLDLLVSRPIDEPRLRVGDSVSIGLDDDGISRLDTGN